ncbi:MAG TPA: N-acetylglucosamine-6-phosphate deacetylase [Pseudoflavonifractor sp.]|nr:N-acetylglucosamine-6-phosphate deacetylase [Pseudoflavonifractor sp.]
MILQSRNVWLDEGFRPAQLVLEDGRIAGVAPYGVHPADLDYGDRYLLPGFIDIHTHGHNGAAAARGDPGEMAQWQREIAAEGVTAFLPSVATQSPADNLRTFAALAKVTGTGEGAEILGIHIEGNFIDPGPNRGAHDPVLIAEPDLEQLKAYLRAAGGTVRLMILAVERDRDFALLSYAVSQGIRVSVGHSDATYDQTLRAVAHGLNSATHVYNGMRPYHHRETGVIGAVMAQPGLYAEIIADGHHVSWPAVELLARNKDRHHLILVTDASPLKGWSGPLPEEIHIDGEGQFRTADGRLCSSSLRMCDGVYNLITRANAPFAQAVCAATRNPAALLGLLDRKGTLDEGKDADVVVVTSEFQVIQTYCRGKAMLE